MALIEQETKGEWRKGGEEIFLFCSPTKKIEIFIVSSIGKSHLMTQNEKLFQIDLMDKRK